MLSCEEVISVRCTLKDIAEALGVTANTVSRALKGKSDISDSTIAAVREKANELGYIPNIPASSLRNGSTKTIALVYDIFLNPYYSIMTTIIENKLRDMGYSIMIFCDRNYEARLTESLTRKILSYSVDGIISFLQIGEGVKKVFDANKIVCIVIGRDSTDENVDSICGENEYGGYTATKHLIDKGKREILFFSLNQYVSCSNLRFAGYQRALKEAGIEFDRNRVLRIGTDGWTGIELVKQALAQNIAFDSIFCANDLIAFEAISELENNGYSVPKDCAVVGYDHLQSHLHLPCVLTTIDDDKEQIAEVACEVIVHKINNDTKKNRLFTKINAITLIEGKTT